MNFAPNEQPYKTNTNEYFFSLTFFYKDLLCYKQIFKGHLSRSNHLFLLTLFYLYFFWHIIRLPLAAYVEICITFDIRNSQMTSTATIDLRGSLILTTFFARATFVSKIFFTTVKWQTIKIVNLQHITLIFVLIILFSFFNVF